MPICNIILYMYIVHSSVMQAAAKTVVINMTFVCHGQDCNSILLGSATSGANELIVFRSHSVCNFQFKIGPTGKKLTCICILCIWLLKLLATRKRMKDKKHGESIKLIIPYTREPNWWSRLLMRDRLLMHTIMELRMRNRVCADLHPLPFKGKCRFFCSLRINNCD